MSDDFYDSLSKVNYPFGFCSPADIAIDKKILADLQREAGKLHILKGAYILDPVPLACIRASSKKQFKALNKYDRSGIISWIWPTSCGRVTSYSVVPPDVGKKKLPLARIFVPADEEFSRTIYKTGILYFFITYKGKRTQVLKADLAHESDNKGLEYLAAIDKENTVERVYDDNEIAYWVAIGHHSENKGWLNYLSDSDTLSISWALNVEKELNWLHKYFIKGEKLPEGRPQMEYTDDTELMKSKFPFIYSVLQMISNSESSNTDILNLMKAALTDNDILEQLVYHRIHIQGKVDGLPDYLLFILDRYFLALQLTTEATQSGTKRMWLDGTKIPMTTEFIQLDNMAIGKKGEEYWGDLDQNLYPFQLGQFVYSNDVPVPTNVLWDSTDNLKLESSIEEVIETIHTLLQDASDNQQWTIPWGARVNINLPDFPDVDLFQIADEIYCVFRDTTDRYFLMSVNLNTKKWMSPALFIEKHDEKTGEDHAEDNVEAEHALILLLSTIIRDFMVVEERESVFGTRKQKRLRYQNINTPSDLNVIYLPRIHYKRNDPGKYLDSVPQHERARHEVRPHVRKVEHASKEQLWLAHRYNISVPRGYTFVRPHARGGLDTKSKQIYRSRSATRMIYDIASTPSHHQAEWFKFERDVAQYMKAKGFTVQHQSINKNGDGGVDVYAYHEAQDEIWAIQCKCYALNRPVGPNVIRELYGSLPRYPEGTRGIVVTTSNFTSGAIEEADSLGIALVNGEEFHHHQAQAQAVGLS